MTKQATAQPAVPQITVRAAAQYLREWMHVSAATKLVSADPDHLYFKGKDQIGRRMEYKIEAAAQADYFNIYEREPDPAANEPWEWVDAISVLSEVLTNGKQNKTR